MTLPPHFRYIFEGQQNSYRKAKMAQKCLTLFHTESNTNTPETLQTHRCGRTFSNVHFAFHFPILKINKQTPREKKKNTPRDRHVCLFGVLYNKYTSTLTK